MDKQMKKGSLFFFALGMAAILMFFACREQEEFDITGTWHFYEFRDNGSQFDLYRTFVGTRMRGELDAGSVSRVSGEYTVSGHRVFIKVMAGRGIAWNIHEYTGRFDSCDYMRGTLRGEHREVGVVTLTWSGTWVARKTHD
jgi:hypothetical protein